MYKNRSQGFTLIELLVVIAIIGVLSAVVLASLNTARSKGNDAAVQSDLNTVQTQAELVYSNASPNSYGTFSSITCSTATTAGTIVADATIQNALKGAKAVIGTDSDCAGNGTSYSVAAPLTGTGAFCIDSTGYASSKKKSDGTTPYSGVTGANGAHAAAGALVCQ
jgi:type IV pilus assembly protein PilA